MASNLLSDQLDALETIAGGAVFGIDSSHHANGIIRIGCSEHDDVAFLQGAIGIAKVMGLLPVDFDTERIGQNLLELVLLKGQNHARAFLLNNELVGGVSSEVGTVASAAVRLGE